MTRRPDPIVPGLFRSGDSVEVGVPPLPVPGWLLLELLPRVRDWQAVHERQGASTKLAAAAPYLARWEFLASLERQRFASESVGGGDVAEPGTSRHVEFSAAEAADRLGCSPQWVSVLCRRGELAGRKVGRAWMVEAASVEAFRERRAA